MLINILLVLFLAFDIKKYELVKEAQDGFETFFIF